MKKIDLKDLAEELQKVFPSISVGKYGKKVIIKTLLFSNESMNEISIYYMGKELVMSSKLFVKEPPSYIAYRFEELNILTTRDIAEHLKKEIVTLIQEKINFINNNFTENFKSSEPREDITIKKYLEINSITKNMKGNALIAFLDSFGDSINNYEVSLKIFQKIKELKNPSLMYVLANRKNKSFNNDVRNKARLEVVGGRYIFNPCNNYRKWKLQKISPLISRNFGYPSCPGIQKEIFEIQELNIEFQNFGEPLRKKFPDLKKISRLKIYSGMLQSQENQEIEYKDLFLKFIEGVNLVKITLARSTHTEVINAIQSVCSDRNIALEML